MLDRTKKRLGPNSICLVRSSTSCLSDYFEEAVLCGTFHIQWYTTPSHKSYFKDPFFRTQEELVLPRIGTRFFALV
jgi:hypothetical protein